MLMMTISCGDPQLVNTDPGETIPPVSTKSIAVTTIAGDYSAANFEIISGSDYTLRPNLIDGLYTDLAIRAFGAGVYILERDGRDNVLKYDAATMTRAYQENIGVGLNIQDIAVASETKAYISCYNSNDIVIFNPATGRREPGAIDMSRFVAFAGTDSAEAYPYISALAIHGNYLYAACQRLMIGQTFYGPAPVPGDTSIIAVIDTRSNEIVAEIKLNKKNPAYMDILGDRMIVSSTGSFEDAATGGAEMIDLGTNENMGIAAEGAAFGGNVMNVIMVSMDKAYIAVMSDDWTTGIVPFNPTTGAVGAKIDGIGDGFGGMAYDGEKLYVGDRGFESAGVAVINTSTDTVEQKIATSMPPSSLAIIYMD